MTMSNGDQWVCCAIRPQAGGHTTSIHGAVQLTLSQQGTMFNTTPYCDCAQHTIAVGAQIPCQGALSVESLVGMPMLLNELWGRIGTCTQCHLGQLIDPIDMLADNILALCHTVGAAYALPGSSDLDILLSAPNQQQHAQAFAAAMPPLTGSLGGAAVGLRSAVRLGVVELDDDEAALLARQVISNCLTHLSAFLRDVVSGVRHMDDATISMDPRNTLGHKSDAPLTRTLCRVLTLLSSLGSE